MISWERSISDLSERILFEIQTIFVIYKNSFLGEQWKIVGIFFAFLFKLLPKFSDLRNSDDCIGKLIQNIISFQKTLSKYIRLYPVYIKEKILIIKKKWSFLKK